MCCGVIAISPIKNKRDLFFSVAYSAFLRQVCVLPHGIAVCGWWIFRVWARDIAAVRFHDGEDTSGVLYGVLYLILLCWSVLHFPVAILFSVFIFTVLKGPPF